MALAGDLQRHRLLALARIDGQGRPIEIGEQGEVLLHHRIGQLLELRIHRERVFLQSHRVAQALAHLLHPIGAGQDRQQHPELGPLAEMALQIAAHRHIELLIRAAQLHIRLDRHRVVPLQQRVQKLMQGNRRARAVAVGEILLRQHLTHRARAQQLDHLRQIQPRQPFAVAPHLQAPRRFEIQQRPLPRLSQTQLHQVRFRVRLHLRRAQLHPCGALAGGIADAGREIPQDQHRRVARLLERPQPAKQDRMAQVDVAAGGVDAQLHPQRPTRALRLRQPRRQVGLCIGRIAIGEKIGQAPAHPCRQRRRSSCLACRLP